MFSLDEFDEIQIRVYSEDTDLMGIVYHANYLKYFDRARTEMIRKSGLSLTMLAQYDCHFVITEAKLHYLAPAFLDDWLTVSSKIESKTSCSLNFEQNISNQDGKLLCRGFITLVCVNANKKPKRIPENLFSKQT